MRLKTNDIIAGATAKDLRELFRGRDQLDVNDLKFYPKLNLKSKKDSVNFLKTLEELKYIEKNKDRDYYDMTTKGNAVAFAKFVKPISKEKSKQILDDLIVRAKHINDNDYYISNVEVIRVFGSYIDPEMTDCADVDVMIELKLKDGITFKQATALGYKRSSHKSLNMLNHMSFAQHHEPLLYLKNKNKYISLCADDPENHKHEIIFNRKEDNDKRSN